MKCQAWALTLFLILQSILYGMILSCHGRLLILSQFISIVLCFLFALSHLRKGNGLMVFGAALTIGADFCLVLCDPIEQLYGMLFFLAVQGCYCAHLYRTYGGKSLMALRAALSLLVIPVMALVLGAQTDALALVSMVYYVNLIFNLITAVYHRKKCALLIPAFILFILCDTVIGLQVAAGSYLPIDPASILYRLLFSPFPLAWFFYLPSQVLLVLYTRQKGRIA